MQKLVRLVVCIGAPGALLAQPYVEKLNFADITMSKRLHRPNLYVLTGDQIRVSGLADGSYPQIGRAQDELSGYWNTTHKMLDSLHFSIERESGERLPGAEGFRFFEHRFSDIHFIAKSRAIELRRWEIVSDSGPSLFSTLEVKNHSEQDELLTLSVELNVNIRFSRFNETQNGKDVIFREGSIVRAYDPLTAEKIGFAFKVPLENFDFEVHGSKVLLRSQVFVAAGEKILIPFVLSGDNAQGFSEALRLVRKDASRREAAIKLRRQNLNQKIDSGLRFHSSSALLNRAFKSAKANIFLSEVDYRVHGHPHKYLASGFPVYTHLFGTDLGVSLPGLLHGGLFNLAKENLQTLIHFTKISGITPHQVTEKARVLSVQRTHPTLQLIKNVWFYYQFSGDRAFIEEHHEDLELFYKNQLQKFHPDNEVYPRGVGVAESRLEGQYRVSSAALMYEVLIAMAKMSGLMGNLEKEFEYSQKAKQYQDRLSQDWWSKNTSNFATALDDEFLPSSERLALSIFPLYSGVARSSYAQAMLQDFQNNWQSDFGIVGTYRTGDIRKNGVGLVQTNMVATSAFKYDDPIFGMQLLVKASRVASDFGMSGLFGACQPNPCENPMQLWSSATFLEALVVGLLGITFEGGEVRFSPLFPRELSYYEFRNLRVKDKTFHISWSRTSGLIVVEE